MYRTPVRPAQSPDNIPEIHHSPPSWADSSSPGRPRRSRSQGRSPGRSHRSRSRGRSRSRSRSRCSRSRGRSKSRTRRSRSRDRSRSRPRRSRSRGRSRHSPSEESRYSYERRSSPCFLSAASSDPSAPHNDPLCMRAEEHAGPGPRALDRYDGRSVGPRASASGPGDVPGKYHAVGELPPSGFPPVTPNFQAWAKDLKRPPEEPLPMPKKSILKKRPEVESGNTAGVQINSYSSHKEMSTTYLFPSANPSLMERAAGSSSSSSAGIIGRGLADDTSTLLKTGAQANQNSPTGSTAGLAPKVINESGFPCSNSILAPSSGEIAPPASANNQTSSGSGAQLGLEETKSSQYSSKMGNFLHMFNKSACEAQGIPYNPSAKFPDPKGAAQQKAQPPKSAASPNEPPKDSGNKMVPAPKRAETSKPPEKKFRSRAEIEDEERFLYGDEELKKPTPGAVNRPPASAAPKPVAHSPPASAQSAPSPTPAPSTSVPKNLANKQQYEKIHDLLKTIGLDIGVAEIGKLAVRTQERLHGKKSLPGGQTPECRPSVTDPKPADSRPRKHDMSPAARRREPESPTTHELDAKPIPRLKDHTPPATQAIPSLSEPTPAPISPSQMQVYSPYPSGAQIMPSYGIPPPAYNPYTPYVAYPTSSWSVYSQVHQPPPTHVAPPLSHMVVSHSTTISRSNLRVIETSENAEVLAAGKKEALAAQVHQLIEKQEAERNNKEIEKQKVLEELDDLRREQRTKTASLDSLCAKVEQLRVQQGILLRKKRREKDGHKDPLLEELNNAVENAQKQLSVLRKELQAAIQKQQQLTKVAEILGAAPAELADRRSPAHASKDVGPTIHSCRDSGSHFRNTNNAKSKDDSKSSSEPHSKSDPKPSGGLKSDGDPKPRSTPPKSNQKTLSRSRASSSPSPEVKARPKSPRPGEPTAKTTSKESLSIDLSQLFEYYDEGYHWCEDCGSVCTTVIDYLLHMHSKKHVQMSNPPKRPWTKKTESEAKPPGRQTLAVPMKGLEFLFPTNGFYCQLCEELFADQTCAEQHLRTFAHNDKYKKYTDDNPQYEQKRQNKQKAVAEEALHKQKDEQKRKLFEQFNESAGESKFKRARPDDDEEESAKQKQSAVAPPSAKPDPRQNLKPERSELGRTQSFGKFSWKTQESKSQNSAGEASKDESAVHGRQKEEEGKTHAARNKSIEIKLMGKGSASHGSSCSSSTASPSLVPQTKVRPNLPVPINVLRKSGVAPLSKPAPLNTFLSIKSSSKFSSKPPKAEEMSQEASKAFGGQEKEKRESSQNQVVGKAVSGPESSGKKALESSGQKSDLQKMPPPHVSAGTQKGRSSEAFDMFHKDKEPEKKLSPNLHPGSFKAAGTKAVQIKNEPSASGRNEASKSPISAQKGNVSETPRLAVSASVSPSSNKQPQRADGVEPTQSGKNSTGSQQAQAKAAANKPTTKSNPVSAAAITPQKCAPSPVSQQGKTSPAVIPPVDSAGGTGSVYSNTAKLIQKFKREPLPLPTSLFCHGPDKRSSSSRVPNASSSTPIISSRNQTAPGHASARPRFQEGIESYYKLVAPEDDPEDVTTSEDQDAEADAPVGVVVLPVQPKSTIPEKKADKPPVTAQVPESADDADDSDMACEEEAPEAPAVTVFTGSPKTHATSTLAVAKSPLGAAGARLDSPNTEVEMDISPEYSMEDLAVMTTCDSD